MNDDVLLSVKDLDVFFSVYKGRSHVLNTISFYVNKGEKLGLVGETGCGKTTTLKALMKVLDSNAHCSGRILYTSGKRCNDIYAMNAAELLHLRRTEMSMIFQDPTSALNPVFTVGEQISSVIRANLAAKREPSSKKIVHERAVKALSDVYLPDPERILQSYPFQLSGGMRQRICIAMSVATERNLLLADEPGTSLDVTIQDQILRLINRLVETKGMSFILVSHSLGVVRKTSDRICIMYGGTIVETGKTKDLFDTPCHPYTKALLSCVPKLSGTGISEGIPGEIINYVKPPAGCRFHPRCVHSFPLCREEQPRPVRLGNGHEVSCHLYTAGS